MLHQQDFWHFPLQAVNPELQLNPHVPLPLPQVGVPFAGVTQTAFGPTLVI